MLLDQEKNDTYLESDILVTAELRFSNEFEKFRTFGEKKNKENE